MSDSPSKEFDVGSIDASSKQDGGISSSTTTEDFHSSEEQRDEVKEILKMTQKDTKRVIFWRFACTAALAVTAFAVTFTTYRFLKAEEKKNFETAVSALTFQG